MTRAQKGDGKTIEVRLINPPGVRFVADQYSVNDDGYVLDNPALQISGSSKLTLLTEGDRAIIPHTNVQYAIESFDPGVTVPFTPGDGVPRDD